MTSTDWWRLRQSRRDRQAAATLARANGGT